MKKWECEYCHIEIPENEDSLWRACDDCKACELEQDRIEMARDIEMDRRIDAARGK